MVEEIEDDCKGEGDSGEWGSLFVPERQRTASGERSKTGLIGKWQFVKVKWEIPC